MKLDRSQSSLKTRSDLAYKQLKMDSLKKGAGGQESGAIWGRSGRSPRGGPGGGQPPAKKHFKGRLWELWANLPRPALYVG